MKNKLFNGPIGLDPSNIKTLMKHLKYYEDSINYAGFAKAQSPLDFTINTETHTAYAKKTKH